MRNRRSLLRLSYQDQQVHHGKSRTEAQGGQEKILAITYQVLYSKNKLSTNCILLCYKHTLEYSLESHTLNTFPKQPSDPAVFGSFHRKTSRSHDWGCSNHMSPCDPRLLKMDFYGGPLRLERRWNREYRWEIKIIERQKKNYYRKMLEGYKTD